MKSTLLAALALFGVMFSSQAQAAQLAPRITETYARRIVLSAVKQAVGSQPYKVKLDHTPGTQDRRTFTAAVSWGKGPHIWIALPTYRGSIDMRKDSPLVGVARVSLATRGTQPNQ